MKKALLLISALICGLLLNAQTTIWDDDFSTDKGWTLGGSYWERGAATSEPATDHSATSDNYIMACPLGSDYPNNMSVEYSTSPTINCSGYENIQLSLWSFSGCETATYDHMGIEVYNGSSWVEIWSNSDWGGSTQQSAWSEMTFDVSAYADNNSSFSVRFYMGTTDVSSIYSGWGIDDISITGTASCTSPTTQATSIAFSNIEISSMDVSWTRGSGDGVIVVVRANTAPGDPSSGTTYTANATYGSGDACGSGFVVYNGTGTSVSVTGLTGSTNYYFNIYEYNNTDVCYNLGESTGSQTTSPAPISLPYTESFETGSGAWTVDNSGAFLWTRNSGGTISTSTGPSGAQNGSYYYYTEASSGATGDDDYITQSFNFAGTNAPELSFYYHMYGSSMGTLSVEANNGSGWVTLWSKTGQQHTGTTAAWTEAVIDLSSYGNNDEVQIRFHGERGSNYYSDMAIDNINITEIPPMEYVSSTATQNTDDVAKGTTNNHVLGIVVVTTGIADPLDITQLVLNTTGTTDLSEISNAKIWTTGTSSTFATVTQIGSTILSPSGAITFNDSYTLSEGANYFWLTYDVDANATTNNYIDAQCTQVTVDGTNYSPTVISPTGARRIAGMYYTSSTTTQNVTTVIQRGTTNNQIIGIEVVADESTTPIDITQFNFNTTGSTNASADITNAKLWSTGTSGTFTTSNQLGTTYTNPSGNFNITCSHTLTEGTNYFWLTYDVISTATVGNITDAQCTSVTVDNNTETPTVTNPTGFRAIASTPGADCSNPNVISSVPYSASATTCGFGNDFDYTDACGSNYMNGEDRVYTYTPDSNINVRIELTNTDNYTGVFVLDDCPDAGATCVANNVSSTGNPLINGVDLVAGTTYYIIVSTWPAPQCTDYDISITEILPATEHDCFASEPVCQNEETIVATGEGIGNYHELDVLHGCFSSTTPEHNTTWFVFTAQNSGPMTFTITAAEDVDFALYEITNSSNPCQDIIDGVIPMMRCSWSTAGNGGLNLTATDTSEGSTGDGWLKYVDAVAGNRYILLLDRYTNDDLTYDIDFNSGGGTADIVDDQPPSLADVVTPIECGASSVQIEMSEFVECSSVDASFFTLTGPGSTVYTVTGISGAGIGCSSSGYDNNFILTVSPSIIETGDFELSFTGGITDICGQAAVSSTKSFTITGIDANILSTTHPSCPNATDGAFEVEGINGTSPYTYDIPGTSQLSGSFSGLEDGTYNTTVTDVRGCNIVKEIILTDPATLDPGTISGTQTICDGSDPIQFTGTAATTGSGTVSYQWQYTTDMTGTSGWADIPGATTQNYDYNDPISSVEGVLVRRKVTDNCNIDYSNNITITVTPPVADAGPITADDDEEVCSGETGTTYSIDPVSGATGYAWDVPTGANIVGGNNTESITVDWGTATSGNITVTPNNTSCSFTGASSTIAVIVLEDVADVTDITGDFDVCYGDEGVVYTITDVDNATDYTWTAPTGASPSTGTGTSFTVDFGTALTGNISVTPSNNCDAGTAYSEAVTITPELGPIGNISGQDPVCFGETGVEYTIPSVDNADDYTWDVPTNATFTGEGTNTITVDWGTASSGDITVIPSTSNGCFTGTEKSFSVEVIEVVGNAGTITGEDTVCNGANNITYSIADVANATGYTWNVPNNATFTGDGTTSITVDFATATDGDITVTPTNSCGSGNSDTLHVVVTPDVPAAGAISGNTTVCYGDSPVTYSIAEITEAIEYTWTLPAGASFVSGQGTNEITVDFGTAAGGDITVTPSNDCSTGVSNSISITVTPEVDDALSIVGNSPVCYGATGESYSIAEVNGAVTYEWTVPGTASIATGTGTKDITINWGTTSGTGVISVTPKNSCFSGTASEKTITITPSVEIPTFNSGPVALCQDAPNTTYSASAANSTSITYSISPGSAGSINPATGEVDWDATFDGTATITATAEGCNGPKTATREVVVSVCNCSALIDGPIEVCDGSDIELGITGSWPGYTPDDTTYVWSPAGNTETITTSNAGNYYVTVTYHFNTSSCVAISPAHSVSLVEDVSTIGSISANDTVCYGTTGESYTIPAVTNATNYVWQVPSGANITGGQGSNSITVNWGNATTGDVTVYAENSCFNTATALKTITVTPEVDDAGAITGENVVCFGYTKTYTIDAVTGASEYEWTVPAGADIISGQGTNTIEVDFDDATGGSITVTPKNHCYSGTSNSINITITPLITSGNITGDNTVCEGDENVSYALINYVGATDFTWSVPSDANIVSGQGNDTLIVNWGGTSGDISVTPSNSCFTGTQASLPVTVTPELPATGTISGLTTVCYSATNKTYSIPAIAEATGYTWTVPADASIISGQNTNSIVVNFEDATAGEITVTPENNCFTGNTESITITITPEVANAGSISGPTDTCYASTNLVYTIEEVSGATNYNWTIPNGASFVSGQGNDTLVINLGTATGGQITVTPENTCFEGDPASITLNITPQVSAAGTISGATGVCHGATGETYTVGNVTGADTYTWSVPTDASITAGQGTNTITVDFGDATSGSISVTPSNECYTGNSSSLSITITPEVGAAGIISGPATVCYGQDNITYSINTVAGANNYTWTVPTGATISSGQNTTTIVVDMGTATSGSVSVTPSNGCFGGTANSKDITITPLVDDAGSISGNNVVCHGDTITYNITDVNGATDYTWTVPNNASILTGQGTNTISVDFGTATSGYVTVKPFNDCHEGDTTMLHVTVTPLVANAGTITGDSPVCYDSEHTYTISDVSGTTDYTWTVPSGAIINAGQGTNSISVDFETATGGYIRVTPENACFTGGESQKTIVITPGLGETLAIAGEDTVCYNATGEAYSLPSVSGATTYTWTAPSGASVATGQDTRNITIDFGTSTGGNITVTPSNSCFIGDDTTFAVTVTPLVAAAGSIIGDNPVCYGATDVEYSIPTASGATEYEWTKPGTASIITGQGTNTITVDWGTTSGVGTITVTPKNSCYNGTQGSYDVTITPSVEAPIFTTGSTVLCQDSQDETYTATAANSTNITYSIDPVSAGTINSVTGVVNWDAGFSGTATITATAEGCNGPVSTDREVTINICDCSVSISGPNTVCEGDSIWLVAGGSWPGHGTAIANYEWSTNETNDSIYVGSTGNYTLTVTYDDGGQCTNQYTKHIDMIDSLDATGSITGDNTICFGHTGDNYTTDPVSGATDYTWTVPNGANVTAGQGSTNITVDWGTATGGSITVQPSNSCFTGTSSGRSITITPALGTTDPITGLDTVCYGQTGTVYSIPEVTGADTYDWSLPAGASISADNGNSITVSWGTSTGGNISVQASNNCFNGTIQYFEVTVTPELGTTPDITGITSVCYGDSGNVYSITPVSGATDYEWTLPSGAVITAGDNTNSITVDFETALTGYISVTPSNHCFPGNTKEILIKITPPLSATNEIAGEDTVCYNATNISYTIPATSGADNYTWSAPSGASVNNQGSNNISIDFGTANSGNIIVTPSNDCFTGENDTLFVTVTPEVDDAGSITGDNVVCYGESGNTYSIDAVNGAINYTWTLPTGANILSGQGTNSITVDWNTSNGGTIRVRPSNDCYNGAYGELAVTVTPEIEASGLISGNDTVCFGDNNQTYSIPLVTGATNYQWFIPSGATVTAGGTSNSIIVNFGTATSGSIKVLPYNDCFEGDTSKLELTITPEIVATGTISGEDTVCYGETDIQYQVTSVSGASDYTWTVPTGATITSGQGTNTIIVNWGSTVAGNRIISVLPNNYCYNGSATTYTVYVTPQVGNAGSIQGDNPICYGASGIQYNIGNVSGATEYEWTVPNNASIASGQGTNTINLDWGTTAGTGMLIVTPRNECFDGGDDTLYVNVTPSVTTPVFVSGAPALCQDSPNEIYEATANNSTGITYSLSPSTAGTINTVTGEVNWAAAFVGTATITATAQGCNGPLTETFDVEINTCDCSASISGPTQICDNEVIDLVANGAWPNHSASTITYQWAPSAYNINNDSIQTMDPGTYYVTITYEDGVASCTALSPGKVVDAVPTIDAPGPITGDAVVCYEESPVNYSIATVTGATSYTWGVPAGASIIGGQGTGNISVDYGTATAGDIYVVPTNTCFIGDTSRLNITITPAPDAAGNITGNANVCAGNVEIYSISDVNNATTYTWEVPAGATIASGQGTNEISVDWGSSSGGNVTVTPENNCFEGTSNSLYVSITLPAGTPTIPIGTGLMCQNSPSNDYVTSATDAVSYDWTLNPASAGTITGTGNIATVDWDENFSGTVQIIVAAIGCNGPSAYVSKEVTIIPKPTPSISGDNVICELTEGLTYETQNNAGPGVTYDWAISTNGGFVGPDDNPSVIVNWIAAGNELITVKETITVNGIGCPGYDTMLVTVNELPDLNIVDTDSVLCNGGNTGFATVEGIGGLPGYTFTWDNPALTSGLNEDTVTDLTANIYYHITVEDANGCSSMDSVIVYEPEEITSSFSSINVSCYGGNDGSATITPEGGTTPYSYVWSGGSVGSSDSIAVGLNAFDTYQVTVTDDNGCEHVNSIQLTQPQNELMTSITDTVSIRCFNESNGEASVEVSGGTTPYTYAWDNPGNSDAASVNDLTAGTYYHVTISDAQGCSTIDSIMLWQPSPIDAEIDSIRNVLCHNNNTGYASISVEGGNGNYTYNWSSGSTPNNSSTTGFEDGDYTVTVNDYLGCDTTLSFEITQPSALIVTTSTIVATCNQNNGIATATPIGGTPGYEFLWSNGTQTQSNSGLAPGQYNVTVTDANNCTETGVANVGEIEPGTFNVLMTPALCYGSATGVLEVNVNSDHSPFTYNWDMTAEDTSYVDNLEAGQYSVQVIDSNDCVLDNVITTVTQPDSISVNANIVNIDCYGNTNGTITLTATGGTGNKSYSWDTGVQNSFISDLDEGTYTVTVTDANDCESVSSYDITAPDSPVSVSIDEITNVTCHNGTDGKIVAVGSGGTPDNAGDYYFTWLSPQGTETYSRIANNLAAGTSSLTVTDMNGCSTDTSIIISQPDEIAVTYSYEKASCIEGEDAVLIITGITGGTAPYDAFYMKDDGASNYEMFIDSIAEGLTDGTYNIRIEDINDCYITTTAIIPINEAPCIDETEIPTVFTPNGDNNHDTWGVKALELYPNATIEVFNRWGEIIFSGKGNERWDGTYNGKDVATGSYIFIIDLKGVYEPIQGIVTIVR